MEIIEINGHKWQKYKGDEGQDVFIALFTKNKDDMLGKYAEESDFDVLINGDADVYLPPVCDVVTESVCDNMCIKCVDENRIAFKFRKNVFTQEEQDGALKGLWDAAVQTNNRGMAAGPRPETQGKREWATPLQVALLDYFINGSPPNVDGSDPIEDIKSKHAVEKYSTRGVVWGRAKVEKEFGFYDGFFDVAMEKLLNMSVKDAAEYAAKLKGMISKTNFAAQMWSGIAGYYGRYPRFPFGRPTSYTENHKETFELCYPFARKLDAMFAKLLPQRYAFQKKCADSIDKRFLVGEDTTFTTITVNTTTKDRNARMACHLDAGSLNEGFSNLTVIGDGKKSWSGGYLVAPEVRAAINVRPGDLLLIDNMRIIHGNTPIYAPEGAPEDDLLRMSLVFYFREDLLEVGSYEYEAIRRSFVLERSKNEAHPLWKPLWNGVSANMFEEEEWRDYLIEHGGEDMVRQYHPEFFQEKSSLEDFF